MLTDYRNKIILPRRVLCTGNPDKSYTIAAAIRNLYPDATFIHKSNGYDFKNLDDVTLEKLKKLFTTHSTFINASYVAPFVQSRLLDLCKEYSKVCDVFNIGSTNEYDNLGKEDYKASKLDLRQKSLEYNSYRFKTCHIVTGGIKTTDSQDMANWLDPSEIASLIDWVTKQRFGVPIISIDQPKQPW